MRIGFIHFHKVLMTLHFCLFSRSISFKVGNCEKCLQWTSISQIAPFPHASLVAFFHSHFSCLFRFVSNANASFALKPKNRCLLGPVSCAQTAQNIMRTQLHLANIQMFVIHVLNDGCLCAWFEFSMFWHLFVASLRVAKVESERRKTTRNQFNCWNFRWNRFFFLTIERINFFYTKGILFASTITEWV